MPMLEHRLKMRVGGLGAHSAWAQTKTASDTVDVSIHRKSRPMQSEEQHDRSSLRPDTLEAQQPLSRLFHRQLAEKMKR